MIHFLSLTRYFSQLLENISSATVLWFTYSHASCVFRFGVLQQAQQQHKQASPTQVSPPRALAISSLIPSLSYMLELQSTQLVYLVLTSVLLTFFIW